MTSPLTPPLAIGMTVRLMASLPYVKTAESKPMLRPGTLVAIGETGTIVSCHPGRSWGVRFDGGTFLIDAVHLEAVEG